MMAPPANRPAQCRQPDTKRGNSTVSFGFNRKRYCLWHSSQAESQEMLDHADEIVAALVLCLAAGYSVSAVRAWHGTRKLRREIEYLDSQGRQIFKLIANEDKKPA
jgi:hypothetical protein